MPDHRCLSLDEVAVKLKIGETTLNVWRRRYNQWMPSAVDEDGRLFPESIVKVLRLISQCTHVGMEPHDIERVLDSRKVTPVSDGGMTEQTLAMVNALKDAISGVAGQQQRIADAQDRRAMAEERKAYAMESQAEAELIKANALKDIVALFQDMAAKDSISALMDKVKNMPGPSPIELEDFTAGRGFAPEQLADLPELNDIQGLEPEYPSPEALGEAIPDFQPEAAVDENESVASFMGEDVDDLSLLVDDEPAHAEAEPVDDLSALLEPDDRLDHGGIDDLSMLLDQDDEAVESLRAVREVHPVDDLSQLLDPEDVSATQAPSREPQPSVPADETYKSKILKRIIQMKQKEKLSVEETTRRFNEEGVKTLSGKGAWDIKTIQGIYKYIDSVQG